MNDDQDPNQYKNRIPTVTERTFLLQSIDQQEVEILHAETKIATLRAQAEEQRIAVQECLHVLGVAKEVEQLARLRLNLVLQEGEEMARLRERAKAWETPSLSSAGAMYQKVLELKNEMEEMRKDDEFRARAMVEKTAQQVYDLGEELDANKSILAFTNRSIAFLVNLKEQCVAETVPMKSLLGARRRMPRELWRQIFLESVVTDEEEYRDAGREGTPPFTALKLSSVCHYWRVTIQDQPALWQYIAIPRASEISRAQWDRVDHHRILTRDMPPIMYVVPDSRGQYGSALRQYLLLQQFPKFRSLELRVSRRTSEAEDLLAAIAPKVEELILIGSVKQGSPGTSCPLTYKALKNVETIRCIDLHPFMRHSSPPTEQLGITSAHFKQTYLETRNMIQFLDALPALKSLRVELYSKYTIEADNLRTPVTFHNLKSIEATLAVLHALFTDDVTLPALQHVTLHLIEGAADLEAIEWSDFLAIHQRRASIERLTMNSTPRISWGMIVAIYAGMVQLPELVHLEWKGAAALDVLGGWTASRQFPPKLQELEIVSRWVRKEDITKFAEQYCEYIKTPLTIRLNDCLHISEDGRDRLVEMLGTDS